MLTISEHNTFRPLGICFRMFAKSSLGSTKVDEVNVDTSNFVKSSNRGYKFEQSLIYVS